MPAETARLQVPPFLDSNLSLIAELELFKEIYASVIFWVKVSV